MIRFCVLNFCLLLTFHDIVFANEWESNPAYGKIKKVLVDEARSVVPPDALIRGMEDHSRYYEKKLKSTLEKLKLKEATKVEDRYLYAFGLIEVIEIMRQRGRKTSVVKKELDVLDEYLISLEKDIENEKNRDAVSAKMKSEIYRLIADVKSYLAPHYGLAKMIGLFSKSDKYLKKSLKFNKKNAQTIRSLAISYYFKPRIAGGSVKKSIRLLNEALDYSKETPVARYEIYTWLANAYSKAKKKKKPRHP